MSIYTTLIHVCINGLALAKRITLSYTTNETKTSTTKQEISGVGIEGDV